ncbi:MAG: EFR1 family ferrodoxin, partial [Clostridiales bacterium]|nr:EFR1 family ferrodoxin [Clostridiales bacterium]
MIFYFSATGNCQYVTNRIAAELDEQVISINDCLRSDTYEFPLKEDEMVGFVTPVYLTSMPEAILTFIDRLSLDETAGHYVWHVVTYGRDAGNVSKQLAIVLGGKGIQLLAAFQVRMLTAYTPLFDVSDSEKVAVSLAAAEPEIDKVIEQIRDRQKTPEAVTVTKKDEKRIRMMRAGYNKIRKTKSFSVGEECIGCGKCADFCPDQIITIQAGKPVW